MDLLEAFIDSDIKNKINILWEDNKPLFRATEIEPIFDIKISKYFDTVQKVKRVIKAPHGPKEVTFYTETGLYELIMVSKKNNTRVFKNWIGNILISIREKGKYDLLNGKKDNIENYITHHCCVSWGCTRHYMHLYYFLNTRTLFLNHPVFHILQ